MTFFANHEAKADQKEYKEIARKDKQRVNFESGQDSFNLAV